ncbi:MAG: hypothetical protein HY209_00965 [Candidatus Omnitrophica bacterium]|nr:hypothetical protein [Candidatus Omnitrophota bacterium]
MHHTKVKADIGLCKVITDLTVKGHVPCVPLSEHQPFDLIVVMHNKSVLRLQVKFATLRKNGTVEVRYRRNWADKKGVHTESYSQDEFDYYAIYCPEKDVVLYVRNSPRCPKTIRFHDSANNQAQYVKWAKDYLEI